MVSNSRKKAPKKEAYCSHYTENKFPLAVIIKDSLKKMFSLDVKVTFGGSNV